MQNGEPGWSQDRGRTSTTGRTGPSTEPQRLSETRTSRGAMARTSVGAPPPPRRWLSVLKWLAIAALAALFAGAVAVVLVIRHYEADLPSVTELRAGYAPPQVTRVLARNGAVLGTWFTERRTVVPFAELPAHVKLAFLAAEDAHFYEHEGLNYFGMLRALLVNLRAGKSRQGGSTITQQVVKNVLLEPERTYRRKIRETILARRLEQFLTKDEIFHLYLNHIYLGHGRYGVEEAARLYFGKRAKEMTLAEAALLAGLVASPERFTPRRDPARALQRRRFVLGQMLQKGFITPPVHAEVVDAPLRVAPASDEESELAPEVISHVKALLERLVGERARVGGFTVTTTIDPALQAAARQAVREGLGEYASRQKLAPPFTAEKRALWGKPFVGTPERHKIYVGRVTAVHDAQGSIEVQVGDVVGRVDLLHEERYNPQHLPPSQFAKVGAVLRVAMVGDPKAGPLPQLRLELGPQAALVAIEPRSRHVLALVGSHEALSGGLDRASHARRQPGSSFKPFVYGYALQSRRFSPSSILELPDKAGGTRRISVREALAKSDNAVAERLLTEVGAANVVDFARALGIESPLQPTRSLALGAYEVRPLELTNAYASFANGGEYASAQLVTRIVGPDGREVPLPAVPPKRRVLSPEEAYLVTSLMRGVVEHGTARRASRLKWPVVGKTGTTNDAKDAWFAGYSNDVVASVWVGYDDALPLGHGEAGGVTALPLWVRFMEAAHQGRPAVEFARPANVLVMRVDPATGMLPPVGSDSAIEEEFLEGTTPTETAVADAGLPDEAAAGEPATDLEAPVGDPAPALPTAVGQATPPPVAPEPAVDEPPPF